MKSFSKFVKESVIENKSVLNIHLEHLEDLLFLSDDINAGIIKVLQISNDFVSNSKSFNLSLKIDGSPAIYFGIDPNDKQFFITNKSISANNPKLVKSDSDVDEFWEEEDLKKKLKTAFAFLRNQEIKPNTLYQGDILFTKDDLKNINDNFSSFCANTLTYLIPNKLLEQEEFGIVLHTKYDMNLNNDDNFVLKLIKPDFDEIEDTKGLFVIIPTLNSIKYNFNVEEIEKKVKEIELEKKELNIDFIAKFEAIKHFKPKLLKFINKNLDMEDNGIFGDYDFHIFLERFEEYINEHFENEKTKVKKDSTKNALEENKKHWITFIQNNVVQFEALMDIYHYMIEIKLLLMSAIENKVNFGLTPYILQDTKLKKTQHEGYVITKNNDMIKLVDRKVFSKYNRMYSKFKK